MSRSRNLKRQNSRKKLSKADKTDKNRIRSGKKPHQPKK